MIAAQASLLAGILPTRASEQSEVLFFFSTSVHQSASPVHLRSLLVLKTIGSEDCRPRLAGLPSSPRKYLPTDPGMCPPCPRTRHALQPTVSLRFPRRPFLGHPSETRGRGQSHEKENHCEVGPQCTQWAVVDSRDLGGGPHPGRRRQGPGPHWSHRPVRRTFRPGDPLAPHR